MARSLSTPHNQLDYHIIKSPEHKYIEMTVRGEFDLDQYQQMLALLRNALIETSYKRLLYVNEHLKAERITNADLREVADASQSIFKLMMGGKQADVITCKLNHGLARVWHAMNHEHINHQFQIFDAHQKALDWLVSDD